MTSTTHGKIKAFEERYVGFVDILGFRELVAEAANNNQNFLRLLSAMNVIATQSPLLGGGLEDFRVTTFSDCIAMSARITDAGLWSVILACDALQYNLWPNGILFRGAITKGAMYHDDRVLFGPSFVEAYELESKTAMHPRIMLSDQVYQDALASEADKFPGYVKKHLISLPFDVPCINPFADFITTIVSIDQQCGLHRLANAKSLIETKLRMSIGKPSWVAKWTWLARQYNELLKTPSLNLPSTISEIRY